MTFKNIFFEIKTIYFQELKKVQDATLEVLFAFIQHIQNIAQKRILITLFVFTLKRQINFPWTLQGVPIVNIQVK